VRDRFERVAWRDGRRAYAVDMALGTVVIFITAAAVLALWIDVRVPRLAPQSMGARVAAAIAAGAILSLAPLDAGSRGRLLASMFGALLPAFVAAFLTTLWLLRALRDAAAR
jgi:hypothetical protein